MFGQRSFSGLLLDIMMGAVLLFNCLLVYVFLELQLTCLALSKLKGEHFDLQALESILDDMDLPEAKDILQEVMMTAQVDSKNTMWLGVGRSTPIYLTFLHIDICLRISSLCDFHTTGLTLFK